MRPARVRKQVERHDPSAWSSKSTTSSVAADKEAEVHVLARLAAGDPVAAGEELLVGQSLGRAEQYTFLLVLFRLRVDMAHEVVRKIFDSAADFHSVWKVESVSLDGHTRGEVNVSELCFQRAECNFISGGWVKTKHVSEIAKMMKKGELVRVDPTCAQPTIISVTAKRAAVNRTVNNSDGDVRLVLARWYEARDVMGFQRTGDLGAFTPPRISLQKIMLAAYARAAAEKPPTVPSDATSAFWARAFSGKTGGGRLPNASVPGWGAHVRPSLETVVTPGKLFSDYLRACQRGEASYELTLDHIFEAVDVGPCLCGDALVCMAGGSWKRVRECEVGEWVATTGAAGCARVRATWRATVGRTLPMCAVANVLLTPDHPICVGGEWGLPSAVAAPQLRYMDAVYNLLLEPPGAVLLSAEHGGACMVECATLAQSIPGCEDPLWGTQEIAEAMRRLPGFPNVVTTC